MILLSYFNCPLFENSITNVILEHFTIKVQHNLGLSVCDGCDAHVEEAACSHISISISKSIMYSQCDNAINVFH